MNACIPFLCGRKRIGMRLLFMNCNRDYYRYANLNVFAIFSWLKTTWSILHDRNGTAWGQEVLKLVTRPHKSLR